MHEPTIKNSFKENLTIKGNEQVEVMYGWAVSERGLVRQECLVVNGTEYQRRNRVSFFYFISSLSSWTPFSSAIWAVYSQSERGFYLQVVFNSIRPQLKSFIKFVQKGLFCFRKNGSEKHITRQKNTVVINVFIAKKLDFQNCCFTFLTWKLCMKKFIWEYLS